MKASKKWFVETKLTTLKMNHIIQLIVWILFFLKTFRQLIFFSFSVSFPIDMYFISTGYVYIMAIFILFPSNFHAYLMHVLNR